MYSEFSFQAETNRDIKNKKDIKLHAFSAVKRFKVAEDLQNNSLQFPKAIMKASEALKGKQKSPLWEILASIAHDLCEAVIMPALFI